MCVRSNCSANLSILTFKKRLGITRMAKDLVNLLIVALVLIVGLTLILYFLPCGTTIEKFAPLSPAAAAREVARQQQIRIMQDSVKKLKDFQKVANPTVAQVMSVKATAKKIVDARPYVSVRTAALNVESAGYTPAAVNGAAAVKTAVNNLLVKIGEVSATSSAVKKVLTANNPSPATIKKAKVAAKKLAAPSSKASPAVKAAAKKVVAAKTPAQAKVATAKLAVATAKTPAAKVAAKKVLVKAVAKKLAAPSSKASPAVKAAAMKVVAAKTPAQRKVAKANLAAVASKTPAVKNAAVKVAATKVAAAKTPAQVKAAAKKLIVAAKPNAAATHPAVKAAVAKLKAAKTTKSAKAAAANLVAVSHAVSGTGATASVNNAMLTSAQCSSLCPVGYKNDSTVPAAAIRRTVSTINAANPHVLDTMFSTPLISGFQDVNDPDEDEPLDVVEGFYDDDDDDGDLMEGFDDDDDDVDLMEGFDDDDDDVDLMEGFDDDDDDDDDVDLMEGFDDDDDDIDLMEGFDDDDDDLDPEGFYAPVNKSTMITNYKPEGFYGSG